MRRASCGDTPGSVSKNRSHATRSMAGTGSKEARPGGRGANSGTANRPSLRSYRLRTSLWAKRKAAALNSTGISGRHCTVPQQATFKNVSKKLCAWEKPAGSAGTVDPCGTPVMACAARSVVPSTTRGEPVVDECPLVVPADHAPGELEVALVVGLLVGPPAPEGGHGGVLRHAEHTVVEVEEVEVELGDDRVLVVARVPDDGGPHLVPGQVLAVGSHKQEAVTATRVIELRAAVRPVAVDVVEIESGAAHVDHGVCVEGEIAQTCGGVQGDVVVHQLPQKREPCRHLGIAGHSLKRFVHLGREETERLL